MNYEIFYREIPSWEDEKPLFEGLLAHAKAAKNMGRITPFSFFVKERGAVLAGVRGNSLYGSLYIDLLWVSEKLRGQGIGTRLMNVAEDLGKERKCRFATLTTMDWEALGFYQKRGYQIEYVRSGYDKDSKMYILRKTL